MTKQIKLNETATMTSLEIAELTGKRHDHVIRDIGELISHYKRGHPKLGVSSTAPVEQFPKLEESTYKNSQNKSQPMFILDQDATLDLVMGYSRELRIKVRMRMRELEAQVAAKQSEQVGWNKHRSQGKLARSQETVAIKEFIAYAKGQGSKSPERYYINLTEMVNKQLFDREGKSTNWREEMDGFQLMYVGVAEAAVEKALLEGIEKGMPYKDIFKLAKQRVIVIMSALNKTPLVGTKLLTQ
jgi:Rha family phage regulatory protein